jgi:hypothetical protein
MVCLTRKRIDDGRIGSETNSNSRIIRLRLTRLTSNGGTATAGKTTEHIFPYIYIYIYDDDMTGI